GTRPLSDAPGRDQGRAWLTGGRGRPLALLVLTGLVALGLGPELTPVRALRLVGFDAFQRLAPRGPASPPALIVDIDERSLAAHGQWPWPRTLLARLLARIGEGRPAAVGLDLVMPEPDRLSPRRLAELIPALDADVVGRLSRLPSNDAVLG